MKYPVKWTALLLCAALLIGTLSTCGAQGEQPKEESGSSSQTTQTLSGSGTTDSRTPASLDLTGATVITLSESGAAVEGTGAQAENGVVTITEAGVYAVSGSLEEGRILVNAPGEEVTVALNGADITCSYGSPLYIYQAGSATVHLMEGTENVLTDGTAYLFSDEYSSQEDEEPNACLYSKADLIIEGAGALTVSANYNNGITSKDTLQIYDGAISVTAVNHGINGKDSNTIDSAEITVACGGDAIRATNDQDETLGWIDISNAALDLTAGEDGIQGETAVTISSGSFTIHSGGGSTVEPSGDVSGKGIKSVTSLTLSGGVYNLDCSDDAIHTNGDLTVSGGTYTISTGDDALHADGALTVSAGEIDILRSYEGLEGTEVKVSDGIIHIVSTDDGINAAGGMDGSGFGGFGPGNTFGSGNSDCSIEISGGELTIEAGGDGVDSNGALILSGGTVLVSSTGSNDSALDYDGTVTLSGGTLLAANGGHMSQAPSQAGQPTVFIGFDSTLPAGTYLSLAGGSQSFVLKLPIDTASIVFSSPDLEAGADYTVSYGGSYSGESESWICSGGSYSGGTELTVLTLTDSVTTYGGRGMGDMGGRPGGGMGDRPAGNPGEFPGETAGGEGQAPTGGPRGDRGGAQANAPTPGAQQ